MKLTDSVAAAERKRDEIFHGKIEIEGTNWKLHVGEKRKLLYVYTGARPVNGFMVDCPDELEATLRSGLEFEALKSFLGFEETPHAVEESPAGSSPL
jgi:hypothetical protein